jgi:hypothetical protein
VFRAVACGAFLIGQDPKFSAIRQLSNGSFCFFFTTPQWLAGLHTTCIEPIPGHRLGIPTQMTNPVAQVPGTGIVLPQLLPLDDSDQRTPATEDTRKHESVGKHSQMTTTSTIRRTKTRVMRQKAIPGLIRYPGLTQHSSCSR